MRQADAERRVEALVEFHGAVGDVLRLTDFPEDGYGERRATPKPGRDQEWMAARAKADRLVAAASRSFMTVNATIMYKPRGTWNQYPIDPATHWATVLSDDPMFGPDMLDTMTNRAIGAYQDAVKDPLMKGSVSVEGFSLPAWFGALAYTVLGGLIVAGVAFWLGWVG
ncbi:MAG: hypothetical protein WD651_01565 [Acidimicrobiia bacterium]